MFAHFKHRSLIAVVLVGAGLVFAGLHPAGHALAQNFLLRTPMSGIKPSNQPPEWGIGLEVISQFQRGEADSHVFSASDPDNQSITFSLAPSSNPLPGGLTLDGNGTLSGTPTQDGSFAITLRVSDSKGASADKGFTLDVMPARSCLKLQQTGLAASGTQTIDVDGAGLEPEVSVYCDMTFEGGGWTRLNASVATSSRGFNGSDEVVGNASNGDCIGGGRLQFTISAIKVPNSEYFALQQRVGSIQQCTSFTGAGSSAKDRNYWNGSAWVGPYSTCNWADNIWARSCCNVSVSGLPTLWRYHSIAAQSTIEYRLNCAFESGQYRVTFLVR